MESIYKMNIDEFSSYIKGIRYGYRDADGRLHYADEPDFSIDNYRFSPPEVLAATGCGWCWDVANLIHAYCRANGIPSVNLFVEYRAESFHTTHTQCFAELGGMWYPFPDNSSSDSLCGLSGDGRVAVIDSFVSDYTEYLKFTQKENYAPKALSVVQFSKIIDAPLSDDEYIEFVRSIKEN